MYAFRKILFPVDFSERSVAAVPYVRAVAERFHSEVTALHVIEPPPEVYGPLESSQADLREEELAAYLKRHFAGEGVRRILTVGDPARRSTEFAADEAVDLIMMPTHGYGPFRRFILGSVTAKVLHDADCAVWTAAHIEEMPSAANYAVQNVVCAIDQDEKSKAILQRAGELAEEYNAQLTVVHTVPATDVRPDMYLDTEFRVTMVEAARKQVNDLVRAAGLKAIVCVDAGEIAKVIRHAAISHRADLLVIGRGTPGLMGRLKTHSYSIIRESPCPVLSL